MSLGKGAMSRISKKQKINRKSSIEGELVGVDGTMARKIWSRYFIEAQV